MTVVEELEQVPDNALKPKELAKVVLVPVTNALPEVILTVPGPKNASFPPAELFVEILTDV